jgi:glycine C-acetyltransferase/8-amino-7-oxononanoate synthase
MDGDVAPLAGIVELARRHDAAVVVDEAHATGVLGPGGRGAVSEAGLEGEIDVVIGTLSKALGSYGGYACARREIVELLVNSSRSLIFSTAPPPPAIAGAQAALALLIEQPRLPATLLGAADLLRHELAAAGVPAMPGRTQIVPVVVGDAEQAVALSEELLARGTFAQAIRPPTVPDGSSRLRLTVMASHTEAELRGAAAALAAAAGAVGMTFAPAPAAPVVHAA